MERLLRLDKKLKFYSRLDLIDKKPKVETLSLFYIASWTCRRDSTQSSKKKMYSRVAELTHGGRNFKDTNP